MYYGKAKVTAVNDGRRRVMVRQGQAPFGTVKLDDVDRQIMQLLRHDGRMPYAEIARRVGISEPTTRKRVDRLVRKGAIYVVARVNPAAIGFPIDVHVCLKVERGALRRVGAQLVQMENVAYVGYLTGGWDIMIEAFLPDLEGLFDFISEQINAIDGVVSSETWTVLRTEKFNYMWEGENVDKPPLEDLLQEEDHAVEPVEDDLA
jgi:Lrp/AsnC family transcriptional regulator, regulator for asnA, asnC and gidA